MDARHATHVGIEIPEELCGGAVYPHQLERFEKGGFV